MIFLSWFYVAILGFLATVTNMLVINQRMTHQVSLGDAGQESLMRARSAHHNLLEFGVIFILMLIAFDYLGGSNFLILLYGTLFFFFRLMHIYYMLGKMSVPTGVRIVATAGSHVINIMLMQSIITLMIG